MNVNKQLIRPYYLFTNAYQSELKGAICKNFSPKQSTDCEEMLTSLLMTPVHRVEEICSELGMLTS